MATWLKWLNKHASRAVYNKNPEKVIMLYRGVTNASSKFEKLANNRNLVLLTRALFGKKCLVTFFHSVVGVPITPDNLHYVALSNMKHGVGVEVQPDEVFKLSPAIHIPPLLDLMKILSEQDVLEKRVKNLENLAVMSDSKINQKLKEKQFTGF